MKRHIASHLVSLSVFALLSACGGGSSEIACELAYWDGTIGTCIPEGWHVLDRAALSDRGVPADVLVAFQADEPVSGQFSTITVTREALSGTVTSPDYSEASINSIKQLPGYQELDRETVDVDGQDVSLHVYSAQPQVDKPATRFYQLSAVSGSNGYSFTAATPVSVDDDLEEQILLILRNASFTEQAEEE